MSDNLGTGAEAAPTGAAAAPITGQQSTGLVLRNAMLLMVAQAIATPMAIVVNAVMARYLGPQDFGYIYLAGTFIGFGFLAVDWGQSGMLPQLISRSRERAGQVLGSALSWKLVLAPVVYGVVAGWFQLMGYAPIMQVVLALAFLGTLLGSLGSACQDAVRGFERTDVAATTQVLGAFSSIVVIVPVLLLGGRLKAVLLAQAFCATLPLLIAARALRGMGVRRLSFSREQIKGLFYGGAPFLAFGLAMSLQPSVDAGMLSKLGSMEAVGWHAAARKLVGVLATPAVSLISALYPTLSRLFNEDLDGFKRTTRDALRTSTILAAPLAIGTFMYPDLGVRIFSRTSFGPAEDNLRIFAPFLFLLYFSMPLGACLAAANKTKPWAAAQAVCVLISVIVDPILVPYFQKRNHNGGLGVCLATLASEVLMVSAAVLLVPKGILDRTLAKTIARALLAGAAMVATALALARITPFVAAPLTVIAYVTCLKLVGGLDVDQIEVFRSIISRKRRKS